MIAARAARLLPPATLLSRRSAIRLTLAAALVLHLLAGTALLTAPPHPLAPPPPPPHAATIQLIQNSLARSGDGPVGAAGTDKVNAAALDHPAPPAAAPAVLPDPRRPPDDGTLPAGAAARPPVPAAFPPPASPLPASPLPASPPAPAIRLSGGDDSEGFSGGTAEVPAAADPHAHNRLPAYPTAAAMLGQEGEVGAVVQIRPDGTPAAVLVMHSSGYPALDTAAVKAWQSWRFTPARDHGTAIGSEMPVTLRFVLKR